MKRKKLTEIKVQSFVTNFDEELQNTVKAGANLTGTHCDSEQWGYCWSDNPNYCPTYWNGCTAVNCGSANPC
ncbi:hypothetical protein C900_04836 [Fulvivirga imtechensis AK7]|uniref:Uncharacterized protein n=1 Tax=Fulvivirga imtechensis AK7 TaxID=1237149 RepID=L8JL02_9BACT|nr:pinensin family lanthipeptide [Fulvivirga imtechensis]ELR69611.1 hypothetical protein C900_04836 [Fulvivirga imtechensis AK7]